MKSNNYEHKYYMLKRKYLIDTRELKAERKKYTKLNKDLENENEKMRGNIARLKRDLKVAKDTDYADELNRATVQIKRLKEKIEALKVSLDAVKGVNPQDIWMIEDYPKLRARFKEYVEKH